MIWFFILFLVILVLACFATYKTAEVHELHKVRAAFDYKREDIEKLIEAHKKDKDFNLDYYQGELEELDELTAFIEEEERSIF